MKAKLKTLLFMPLLLLIISYADSSVKPDWIKNKISNKTQWELKITINVTLSNPDVAHDIKQPYVFSYILRPQENFPNRKPITPVLIPVIDTSDKDRNEFIEATTNLTSQPLKEPLKNDTLTIETARIKTEPIKIENPPSKNYTILLKNGKLIID